MAYLPRLFGSLAVSLHYLVDGDFLRSYGEKRVECESYRTLDEGNLRNETLVLVAHLSAKHLGEFHAMGPGHESLDHVSGAVEALQQLCGAGVRRRFSVLNHASCLPSRWLDSQ